MWFLLFVFAVVVIWYFVRLGKSKPKTDSTDQSHLESSGPTEIHPNPEKDAWEGTFYDVVAQRSAKKTVRIHYTDANGSSTERVIDVRAFEPERAAGLVIAHCHTREATRTFRFDRMTRVVDEETGEIIQDLQKLLNDEWEASPEPVMDQLYREHHDVLKLMLYMAKADGAVRAAEIDVISRYCQELTGDTRITTTLIKDLLKAVDVVTPHTFTRLYNKLRRERAEDAAKAASACRAIVGTQKTIHPLEQAALDVLDKPLPALV